MAYEYAGASTFPAFIDYAMDAAYQTFLGLAGVSNGFTFPNIDEFDATNWECAATYNCS